MAAPDAWGVCVLEVIAWRDGALVLIDQRKLPGLEEYVVCREVSEVAEAIRTMVVRGAPAIGVTAAMGMALAATRSPATTSAELLAALEAAGAELTATRPTAVNLAWAVGRMLAFARAQQGDVAGVRAALVGEAQRMHAQDIDINRRIGRHGATLLVDGTTVLTHCNAGALATAGYGTALGVIRGAFEAGKRIAVLADETRPFLQGARLTAWELKRDGIPVTVITDNMAGYVFQKGIVSAVVVGADRIAGNGDTANKIGTYGVAVLADAHRVPFYVAAPMSTVDLSMPDGSTIPIEERDADEVTTIAGTRVVPSGVAVMNPAFDVTPARLIHAIITEHGIARPPFTAALRSWGP